MPNPLSDAQTPKRSEKQLQRLWGWGGLGDWSGGGGSSQNQWTFLLWGGRGKREGGRPLALHSSPLLSVPDFILNPISLNRSLKGVDELTQLNMEITAWHTGLGTQ